MMQPTEILRQVKESVSSGEPPPKLKRTMERWSGYRPTVRIGDTYLIQGYIDILRIAHEFACAVDEKLDPRLPAHCYDPVAISSMFNVPIEKLVFGDGSDGVDQSSELTDRNGIERIAEAIERIAEHVVPQPQPIVGTSYVAERLGCTPTWITDLIRRGEIPKHCCVEGTGNGKPWKFHRSKIDQWLKSR